MEHKYKGGLKYSELIKNGKFQVLAFLKNARKEKKLRTTFQILWRTLKIGFLIPIALMKKKTQEKWHRYSYGKMSAWGRDLCKIAKIKFNVIGSEKIDPQKTYLFASNHLSPYDIPVLSATVPVQNGYIANKQFTSFFVTNFWIKHSGGVFINKQDTRTQSKALKDIAKSLENRNNLILFPEGFMSKDGELQPLNRGGLYAAHLGKALICPVILKGTREVCPPGIFGVSQGLTVHVYFGEPVDTMNLLRDEIKKIDLYIFNIMKKMQEKLNNLISK